MVKHCNTHLEHLVENCQTNLHVCKTLPHTCQGQAVPTMADKHINKTVCTYTKGTQCTVHLKTVWAAL